MAALILPLSIAGVVVSGILILVVLLRPTKENERTAALGEMVKQYSKDEAAAEHVDTSLLTKIKIRSTTRTAEILAKQGWTEKLSGALSAAGMNLKPEEFALINVASGGAGGLILFILAGGSIPAGVFGGMIGLAIPPMVLRVKSSRRQAAFVAEMPDTLTALASGLSAGASLPQALEAVAQESTGPMSDELHRAIIQTRLGTSVADALEESAIRMNCADLQLVVMAIRLQTMHGGNLSDLLNTVSATLRERVQMQRHVRALSAEGRLSLMVLMSLPVMMLAFMAVVRPQYFNFFITTGIGLMMLTGCAVMMLLGYLWARSIVRVEV